MAGILAAALFACAVGLIYDLAVRPDARTRPTKALRRYVAPACAGCALAAGAYALTGWPVVVGVGAILGALAPGAVAAARAEKVRIARREAIAGVAARVRDEVRAGMGLSDGLAQATADAPAVVGEDFVELCAQARTKGLGPAARKFTERMRDPWAKIFGAALSFADRVGPRNLSEVLDDLAASAAQNVATLREAHARQTHARTSARIVAAVPVILLVGLRHLNPIFVEPLSTPGGQVVLAIALAMIVGGYVLMMRLARVEEEPR